MTPTEKAAYASGSNDEQAEHDTLEAVLKELEFSNARTEAVLDRALAEVRAALQLQQQTQHLARQR